MGSNFILPLTAQKEVMNLSLQQTIELAKHQSPDGTTNLIVPTIYQALN